MRHKDRERREGLLTFAKYPARSALAQNVEPHSQAVISGQAGSLQGVCMMAIPESQLATWSHQGAITTAAATHASIRSALGAPSSPIQSMDYEAFLQGSYKNDTNIRGDSDVDLVAQLNSSFQRDLSALTDPERELFQQTFA